MDTGVMVLWGTEAGVMLVLEVLVLTMSPLLRSHDDGIGRLATGWSVAVATDDAGLFVDSGRSDDVRRSDDMGFSTAADDDTGGFVSTGEPSVLTDNWTGSDGGLGVGRGGVVRSDFWLAAAAAQYNITVVLF